MAEPQIIHSEAIVEANSKLCSFSTRWELDGDYMRCRICQWPQLTSYARYPFPHVDGCKGAQAYEAHPWITFVQLLAPLTQAVAQAVDLGKFRGAVQYTLRRYEGAEGYPRGAARMRELLALIDAQKEAVPDELPAFLRWCADELVKRDNRAGSFAHGMAESLRGRAIILDSVGAPQNGEARNG